MRYISIFRTSIPVALCVLSITTAATSAHADGVICSLYNQGHCVEYRTWHDPRPADPGIPGPVTYGAIAYSPVSGTFGYSDNYLSKAHADNQALSECGRADCVVGSWFFNNCGAVAVSGDGAWGGGHGPTVLSASSDAEERCNREGGTSCEVRITHCSGR